MERRPLGTVLWVSILLAVLLVVYRPAFDAPFYLDTIGHLVSKTNLQIVDLSWPSVREAMRAHQGAQGFERPLARLTLALTHWAAGLEPQAYRLGNVAIHWGSALALAFCFSAVLRTPKAMTAGSLTQGRLLVLCLGASTLWALHPVHTGAVTYVIQRMTSLSGLFFFLSTGCYLRARSTERSWRWGVAAAACFGLSLASKESAFTAPLVVLAAETFLLPPRASGRRLLLGTAIAGILALALYLPRLLGHVDIMYGWAHLAPWQHLAGAAVAQARYALVLLIPDPRLLVLDAEVPVPATLAAAWPPALAALALVAGAILAWRRRKTQPVLAFGVAWYLGTQAIEVLLLPMDLYFEHRLYVPSAFWFLGLAWAGDRWLGRGGWSRFAAVAAALALGTAEGGATARRNGLWADPIAFHADNVRKAPSKPGPRINLASHLARVGRHAEATALLEDALALGGKDEEAWLLLAGMAEERGDRDEAAAWAQRVLARGARLTWRAQRFLAAMRLEAGDPGGAEALVLQALATRPYDAVLWELRGGAEAARGALADAEESLSRATDLAPGSARAWASLSAVYSRSRSWSQALAAIDRAVAREPDNPEYRRRREAIAARAHDPEHR